MNCRDRWDGWDREANIQRHKALLLWFLWDLQVQEDSHYLSHPHSSQGLSLSLRPSITSFYCKCILKNPPFSDISFIKMFKFIKMSKFQGFCILKLYIKHDFKDQIVNNSQPINMKFGGCVKKNENLWSIYEIFKIWI